MMRTKDKATGVPVRTVNGGGGDGRGESGDEWEMRPGGMLVQKRNPDSDRQAAIIPPPPPIRVRVKHGSTSHEIIINSQATFGELKKMLTGSTGLHHQDQKLIFKDKERDSNAFLDIVGVKDKSKIVLVEDPISQEKRYLEMRKSAKMEKASKSISEISLEVDRLAGQVSAMDSVINKGGKIPETHVLTLIELLMNQLLKLDGIVADGDVKLQRKMQVKRVQKYVETLDVLKVKNSMQTNNGSQATADNKQVHPNGMPKPNLANNQQQRHSNGYSYAQAHQLPPQPPKPPQALQQPARNSTSGTVVTTNWETFDAGRPLIPVTPMASSPANNAVQQKFNWEFFE
ncbi:hypothetical protein MLD38_025661 [Melastoma candidum]|uniref:Uncharacterized protein n=1 Tax=Melastoma candidum TaxID=119954 RepID=A0ACB9NXG7_9MYRT|nr:hypothetical protein MLD38_025661 [Melastoma candidum]